MRKLGFAVIAIGLLAAAGSSFAEEVVYFTNGTTMPIRTHHVEGGMVHVDLGGNGFMAFPEYMIEKVETEAGVRLQPSTVAATSSGSGLMVAASGEVIAHRGAERAKKLGPIANPSLQNAKGKKQDAGVETDENGLAVVRPFANGTHPRKKELKVTGSQDVFRARQNQDRTSGATGYQGTTRIGRKQVMNGPGGSKAKKQSATGLKPK